MNDKPKRPDFVQIARDTADRYPTVLTHLREAEIAEAALERKQEQSE